MEQLVLKLKQEKFPVASRRYLTCKNRRFRFHLTVGEMKI